MNTEFTQLYSRVLSCSVFNILDGELFATTSVEVSSVFDALGSPTLLCILGSRMLFNLKEAAEHGVNIGTNWTSYSTTLAAIGFEEHLELETGTIEQYVVSAELLYPSLITDSMFSVSSLMVLSRRKRSSRLSDTD